MHRFTRYGFIFCALFAPALTHAAEKPAAQPAQGLGIAAVVGNEAVSSYDVASRLKFILATTKISGAPDVINRIRPQVVRALIDERLQMQEAKKNNVQISEADVSQAVAGIEAQRGMPAGAIDRMLAQNTIPKDTFLQQVNAQLAWGKLLTKKVRPRIHVGDEEIELARKKLAMPVVKQEYQIAVMVLPVDKPSREQEVKRVGDKLVGEVRAGASFEEVARQFSSHVPMSGGKIEKFWVRPEQLDPNVAKVLIDAKANTVTDPLRSNDGFTIIKVYDTRALAEQDEAAMEVMLKEIVLKLKSGANQKEADVLLKIGEEVAKHPGKCDEKGIAGVDDLGDFDIAVNQLRKPMSELPGALHAIAQNLKVGEISPPLASSEGLKLYMLCDKRNITAASIDKERVYQLLANQKMQLEAQKYLRNLRRETFIEIR